MGKTIKKGNNPLKESERTNFYEWIEKAIDSGLSFKIIIDESHQNFTAKAYEIIQLFKTDKIIRCSATPIYNNNDKKIIVIEINEQAVISEGLIKKLLVINDNFPHTVQTDNRTTYLLEEAYKKQLQLRFLFLQQSDENTKNLNPLIVVQLPNN